MFDLTKLSKGKVWLLTILHWIIYSVLCVLIPCMVILNKYKLTGEKTIYITGIGLCILVAFIFIGLKLLRNQVNKIQIDNYLWKSQLKAILSLILSLIIPIIILVISEIIKDNMELALSCIKGCIWSIILGFIEDAALGSSLDRENILMDRAEAERQKNSRLFKI